MIDNHECNFPARCWPVFLFIDRTPLRKEPIVPSQIISVGLPHSLMIEFQDSRTVIGCTVHSIKTSSYMFFTKPYNQRLGSDPLVDNCGGDLYLVAV